MANSVIKVAVIGAGNMGRNHLRTYKMLENVEIVGLADINPAAKELAKEYDAMIYKDYQKLLEKEQPDAVSIVVPTTLHHRIGMDVLGRGIHCLIEKPIASTPAEATELIALAKKKKTVFTVGHIEHYNPMIQKLKSLISSGKIGDVTSIICKRVGGFPAVEPKTDVIIDLAVHDIGVMSYLLGQKPKKIYSHGSRTLHSQKIDATEILINYGDASGFVQANWITPVKIRTIAVTGTKGYVEGNYITQDLVHYEHNMKRISNGFESFVKTLGEPKQFEVEVKRGEPLSIELERFLDTIRGKKVELVSPADAKEALKSALQAIKKYER